MTGPASGTARQVEVSLLDGVSEIPAADWDSCAAPEAADGGYPNDPFTTHRFLSALEASGSVGPGTGWAAKPLIARLDGQMIGVLPLYVKSHSQGEYIFDHAWAHAFERAGGSYYPKLLAAVPFTPATGRRFLCAPGLEQVATSALVSAATQIATNNNLSSFHVNFCTDAEADLGRGMGLLYRAGQQFHWVNNGYGSFEDFLGDLSSRKRKTIRRERRGAAEFGGDIVDLTGNDIRPEHWDAFWAFYQDTGARKWGSPYLTRDFFDRVHDTMRDDVLLVLAMLDGQPVAGALNFIGRDTLYGRYWGCVQDHPFLHFELCYYRAIDYAIENGLSRVEAGAQGQHKLARGYLPVTTHSLHWIADEGFRRAVAEYVVAEADAVAEENEYLTSYGPFRRAPEQEDQQ